MKTVVAVRSLLILAVCLAFTSCLQNSTVIRVKKDGSGEIFERYFFSPQMVAMMGGLGGAIQEQGGQGPAPDPTNPPLESLQKHATDLGEGVRYVRHEKAQNAQGWQGFLVVYEFDDINNITITSENQGGVMNEMMGPDAEDGAPEEPVTDMLQFAMADGVLTIKPVIDEDSVKQITDIPNQAAGGAEAGAAEGGGELDIPPSQAMQMMGAMFAGMRMAIFVRIDGEIAETNATHVNGTLITMSDVDLARLFQNQEFAAFLDESAKNPDAVDVDGFKSKIGSFDGMIMETQDEVTVTYK